MLRTSAPLIGALGAVMTRCPPIISPSFLRAIHWLLAVTWVTLTTFLMEIVSALIVKAPLRAEWFEVTRLCLGGLVPAFVFGFGREYVVRIKWIRLWLWWPFTIFTWFLTATVLGAVERGDQSIVPPRFNEIILWSFGFGWYVALIEWYAIRKDAQHVS